MSQQPRRISMKLDCPAGAKSEVINITQGVPFPDQTLERGAPVSLVDDAGRCYPTQAQCLATWRPDRRHVKWLLVDAQLPGDLPSGQNLYLEYGAGVEPSMPADPVQIEFIDERYGHVARIGNSRLRLQFPNMFRNPQQQFLAALELRGCDGWKNLLRGETSFCSYIIDDRGNVFDSALPAAPIPVITLEERGPVRSSVCVRGMHASRDGIQAFPYVLRLHFFAGSGKIRLCHTFVFDQNPDFVKLAAIGMRLPWNIPDKPVMVFGGEKNPHRIENGKQAVWLQKDDRNFTLSVDGRPLAKGATTRSWAGFSGPSGSAAVVLRDAWQEHPKGIVLEQGGLMDVQLWPKAAGRLLDLEVPWKEEFINCCNNIRTEEQLLKAMAERPTAGVNFKGFYGSVKMPAGSVEGSQQSMREALLFAEKHLKDRRYVFGDVGFHGRAVGLAKTHEFNLMFSADPLDDAVMEDLALSVQTPPLATPAPEHMCSTGAIRLLSARDNKAFPKVDEELDHMLQNLLLGPVEEQRLYGAIDYGDFVNGHARMHGFLYRLVQEHPGVKFTDLVGWFNNESTDLGLALWQYYLRNGGRKFWRAAEAYSEHQEDVDVIHCHPTEPLAVGKSHYHNMLHWSGGPSPSHTNLGGWLLHYYLTGNKRALEVARESAEVFVRNQEPCGVYANRMGTLRREFTGPLAQLWIFYQATWEQKYLDCAKRSLEFFIGAQDASGLWARDVYTDGERGDRARLNGEPGTGAGNGEVLALYDAYLVTKDERYKQSLLRAADYMIAQKTLPAAKAAPGARQSKSRLYGEMFTCGALVAFAYDLSGDERYLRAMREALAEMPEDMNGWAEMLLRVPFQRAVDIPQDAHAMLAAIKMADKKNDVQ